MSASEKDSVYDEKVEKHWSQINESTSTLGIRFLLAVFRLGGRTLFHLTLWPVALFFWAFSARARRASSEYLTQMARFTSQRPPRLGSLAHILRFSDTILDKLLAVSGTFTPHDLRVEGGAEVLADPRGGVIVTAHTGCVELCQEISETQRIDRGLHVLVHTQHAVRFNAIIRKINPRFAVHHIEVTTIGPETAIELSEFIEKGDWIVIVADRTPIGSQSTITIPFLGHPAPFAEGPFILAYLLSAPVWSMICTREVDPASSARYRVVFEKIAEPARVPRSKRQLKPWRSAGLRLWSARFLPHPWTGSTSLTSGRPQSPCTRSPRARAKRTKKFLRQAKTKASSKADNALCTPTACTRLYDPGRSLDGLRSGT